MNLSKKIILSIALTVVASLSQAQSKLGLQYLNEERYVAAESEFAKSNTDEDVFYKGLSQYKLEKNDLSKATFNSIATKPFGKIGLALFELNAANKDGATKLFEEAASMTKNKNPEIFVAISRAIANSNTEDKSEAITWAKKASDMAKTNVEYRMAWGDAYLANQDGGNANIQYEYAQQYAPNTALPYAKIGRVYYRMKVYKESLPNLKQAISIDPNNFLAINYLAQTYYKYKVYDTAEMYQTKVLELGDKTPEDKVVMANILFLKKDYEKAISLIDEIIKGDNKYNHLNRLIGYSYFETGKSQEAATYLEKFLETQPKEKIVASDYEYLGKAYIALGDNEKGVATLKQAVSMNPTDKDAIKAIADNFKSMKMYNEAVEFYQKVVELPDPTADDYQSLAGGYYAIKKYEEADATYAKVIELAPNKSYAWFMRGYTKVVMDPEQSTASAKEYYTKFLELVAGNEAKNKKNVITSKLYLAKIAVKMENDKTKAKQLLDEVLSMDASNAEALELMKFTE